MKHLAHKIQLLPNQEALRYFRRASGVSRFAWNWALAYSQEQYAEGNPITNGYALRNHFNSIKRDQFPWAQEVTKWASQKPIEDLGRAFKNFFKGTHKFPKFKKRSRSKRSFYIGSDSLKVVGNKLRIPNLGYVKMTEEIRFPGIPKSVTITEEGGKWFASFLIELDESFVYPHLCENQAVVGVDLGIKTLATLSDGTKFENPRLLQRSARKVRKLQKSVARKQKDSQNRKKAVLKLRKAYWKLSEHRKTILHALTSNLVKNYRYIGIEDLNVSGMMKNRKLAKHVADASFFEIRRQLEYKAKMAGSEVVLADRFFPSSKLCSSCGYKNDSLTLSDRSWSCTACGVTHDRDLNAARNLAKVASESELVRTPTNSRETLNACGEDVRPVHALRGKDGQTSMKQELSLSYGR